MKTANTNLESIDIAFQKKLTVRDWLYLTKSYPGPIKIRPWWWLHKTDFGMYVLKYACMEEERLEEMNVTWRNWHRFIPTLRRYFLSVNEYKGTVLNALLSKKGRYQMVQENPTYKLYIMIRGLNTDFSIKDILDMDTKTFFSLYLYIASEGVNIETPQKGGHYG